MSEFGKQKGMIASGNQSEGLRPYEEDLNDALGGYMDEGKIKDFLDMIAPSAIKFNTDHFICGNTFRSVWAIREYPTATEEQALLRHLGEKDGLTLHIYTRQVKPAEEKKILQNASTVTFMPEK